MLNNLESFPDIQQMFLVMCNALVASFGTILNVLDMLVDIQWTQVVIWKTLVAMFWNFQTYNHQRRSLQKLWLFPGLQKILVVVHSGGQSECPIWNLWWSLVVVVMKIILMASLNRNSQILSAEPLGSHLLVHQHHLSFWTSWPQALRSTQTLWRSQLVCHDHSCLPAFIANYQPCERCNAFFHLWRSR